MEVHDIVQEAVAKTIPEKKKCKKTKWLSEEALQTAEKRSKAKGEGKRGRHTLLNAELRRARRDEKDFLNERCKEIEENNGIEKSGHLFKKLEKSREHFMQRWVQ